MKSSLQNLLILVLTGFLGASFASAQALGTKKNLVATTPSSSPIVQPMDLVQMVVALSIVAALVKWVLPKIIGRLGRRISTPVGSSIRLEESASFGGGQLQIVTVRGKSLLLCVATTGVSCLADLTNTNECANAEAPVFFDILDKADPTNAVVTTSELEEEPSMSMVDALALIASAKGRIGTTEITDSPLDRLNRLTGSA